MRLVSELAGAQPVEDSRVEADDHTLDVLFGVADVESGDAGDEIAELRERRVLLAQQHRARWRRGSSRSNSSALVRGDRNDATDSRLEEMQVVGCGRWGGGARRRLRRGPGLRCAAPRGAR